MSNVAQKSTIQSTDFGENEIVEQIYDAVIEQQLRPGTKLSESSLCEAFGVGRMRIRSALLLLASRNIVDLQSNRGAYISTPTLEQARQVFEARRAIEPNICRLAVERATEKHIACLEDHLEDERKKNKTLSQDLEEKIQGMNKRYVHSLGIFLSGKSSSHG